MSLNLNSIGVSSPKMLRLYILQSLQVSEICCEHDMFFCALGKVVCVSVYIHIGEHAWKVCRAIHPEKVHILYVYFLSLGKKTNVIRPFLVLDECFSLI